MTDDPNGSRPSATAIGTGLPIAWQGWALTLAYVAIVVGAVAVLNGRPARGPDCGRWSRSTHRLPGDRSKNDARRLALALGRE